MASSSQSIEIGWKKELIEAPKDDCHGRDSGDRGRSRETDHKKKKKYNRLESDKSSSSSSSSSSDSSSCSADSERQKKKKCERQEKRDKLKERKKLKKEQRRAEKREEKERKKELKKAMKEKRKEEKRMKKTHKKLKECDGEIATNDDGCDFSIPIELMFNKARAPETPEEYEARQRQVRRVTDPETGRTRLIKGDGEILEEIVSRERHQEINRSATRGDGDYFQNKTVGWQT